MWFSVIFIDTILTEVQNQNQPDIFTADIIPWLLFCGEGLGGLQGAYLYNVLGFLGDVKSPIFRMCCADLVDVTFPRSAVILVCPEN